MEIEKKQNVYQKDEEEDYEFEERFLELINKAAKPPNILKRYCCVRPVKVTPMEARLRSIFCFSWLHKFRR